jgi:hypothetical protein
MAAAGWPLLIDSNHGLVGGKLGDEAMRSRRSAGLI